MTYMHEPIVQAGGGVVSENAFKAPVNYTNGMSYWDNYYLNVR